MTDLNLRLRLTADGTQVQSAVRSATAALDSMSQSAQRAGLSGISAASAVDRIDQSARSVSGSTTGAAAALRRADAEARQLVGAALPAARALDAVSQSGSVASQVLDRTSASASRTSQHIADMDAGAPGFALARNFNVLSSAAAGLGVVVAGTAAAMFSAARQSQQWEAQLTTATRSTVLANAAQEELTTTANKLGLTVNSTIAAFVRLKNLGLDPGRQAILAYSNVAAGMGTDVQQFIEAVADAATFEFERLKEFGIKASQEGDRVRFTFQGVTTEVEKSARAIERYLQGIGLEQFAGSLERQSKTIDGSLGRINSQFDQFWQNLNDRTGSGEAFARMLDRIARGAEEVNKRLFKPQDADLFGRRLELQLRLQDLQAQESDGRFGFQAGRLKQIQEITAEIGRIDAALSGVLSTQQRQAEAAHSAWEETHRQSEDAERLRSAQDAALAAKERAAKMEKVGSAIDAMFEREARASAAASEQFADALERIKRAADPAYASTQQLAGALSVLEQARAMGPVNGGISEEEFVALSAAIKDLYTGTTAAKAAHEKWLATVQDSIDPMRRFEREAKKVREAFSKGELGDTTASQVEDYLERLRKQAQGTGDALKDAFNAPGKAINEFAKGTGKAIGSLREMFKEGDSGYKALTIGLNALNAMQAINAVLNQSAGDPYTAFARMATMAAAVAALGYSVGMGGGGSDRTAANRQAEQGTGSVLGDATAKTESIARATEITADATTALVGLNRSILVALQGLQAGIAGAVTRIARGAGDVEFDVPGVRANAFDITGLLSVDSNVQQLASNAASSFLNPMTLGFGDTVGKLLGGSSKQVDEGIIVVGGTLAELIDETMVSAYATIKSKKYKWSSSRYNDVTSELPADVGRQFELVFQGIAESVTAGAAALGLEQTAIDDAVSGYVVESFRISLQGLKPEEQREALDAAFGKIFDGLAETVVPYIADFATYGEGLGETLARVANAVMVTEDVVDRLGVQFQQLAGADLADASLRLVELAGGIEELARNSAGFLQNFATPERQMEVITRDLERALGQVNLQLPASRDGFYDLVQAQDASTQSGAEAIATLLRVQAVAADYYDRIESMISDELEARLQANAIVLRAAQDGLAALRAEVTGVSSAAASLSQQMTPAAVQRDAAQQVLSRALTTGDFSGAAAAAASVAQIRASDYASELEFRREQANTLSLLRLVEREGAIQIDYAAAAVDAITAQTDAIRDEAQRGRDHLEALLAERSDQTQPAGVPGFASGGVHAGGWRVVGERGPELEFTGPSRIYSNAQSRALFDTTELLAELRAIRDRVSRIEGHSMHISTSTRQTSRVIERWEIGGLPQERAL